MKTTSIAVVLGLAVSLLSPVNFSSAHIIASEETEVEVIPNPHACPRTKDRDADAVTAAARNTAEKSCSAPECTPSLLLSPYRIIRHVLPTQADTLIGIENRKVLGVPVPVYRFRQPARLSSAQLPFALILVRDVDVKSGLSEVPVDDPARASDSWFPGYRWSPVVCSACGTHIHVGWKFANPSDPEGDYFYALIVEASERKKVGEGVIAVGALGEAAAGAVEVGVRAPGWMVSALARMV